MASFAHSIHRGGRPPHPPARTDTLDLKQKLAVALGENGLKYWQSFLQFCKGAIDRSEFEELAVRCLKPEHVHLHNALILGILYNASADVPGPSSGPGVSKRARARAKRAFMTGGADGNLSDGGDFDDDQDSDSDSQPSRKRLRTLVAGLPKKERLRLKNLDKAGKLSAAAASGANLGWAGSNADLLEKKRKDEEKRKVIEERQRVRELKSAIGAKDWRDRVIEATSQVQHVHTKLSASTQQAIARALQAPLCVESKQLPDLEGIRDRMTLMAVEAGMPGGVQPQAAAMVLSALQDHLQNVASSIITKIRSNRPNGIKTYSSQRPASESPSKMQFMPEDYRTSPAQASMELDLPSGSSNESSPARRLRTVHSDLSSRTSNSGLGFGTSFADSSMLSLASTAPTSFTYNSSPSLHGNDNESTQVLSEENEHGAEEAQYKNGQKVQSEATTGRLTISDISFLLDLAPHTVVEPMGQGTQERLLLPDWDGELEDIELENSSTLSHGALDSYSASLTAKIPAEAAEVPLSQAVKIAATTKIVDSLTDVGGGKNVDLKGSSSSSSTPLPALSKIIQHPPPTTTNPIRARFIIDQTAPLKLLDRKVLVENHSSSHYHHHQHHDLGRPTKGGLSIGGNGVKDGAKAGTHQKPAEQQGVLIDSNGRKAGPLGLASNTQGAGHRSRDEMWEVVDPVALLGNLCD